MIPQGRSTPGFRHHLFLVGLSSAGLWVARDLEGSAEGAFRTQKDAVKFAVAEGGGPNAVLLTPEPVEPSWTAVKDDRCDARAT